MTDDQVPDTRFSVQIAPLPETMERLNELSIRWGISVASVVSVLLYNLFLIKDRQPLVLNSELLKRLEIVEKDLPDESSHPEIG